MEPCACSAREGEGIYRVCEHLLTTPDLGYSVDLRRTAGAPPRPQGERAALVCEACREADEATREAALRDACGACCARIRDHEPWEDTPATTGEGVVKVEAPARYKLYAQEARAQGDDALTAPWEVAAVKGEGAPVWVVLGADMTLWWLDLQAGRASRLGALPERADGQPWAPPMLVRCSDDGAYVAVAERQGQRGVLLAVAPPGGDPGVDATATLRLVAHLDRGDYHEEHCAFSLAFTTHGGQPRLLHATAWNRLDVMDPRTGESVCARHIAPYDRDARPAHYLDYFHCRLDVSPGGERVMDAGWVWHPVGEVRAWSLRAWLEENPFESEDGPSVRTFAWRGYFWDGPACWLDDRRVALWGFGNDDENLIPALWLFDAAEGRELGWLYGPPKGALYADGALFVASPEDGLSAWDPETGARLLRAPSVYPIDYHPTARVFLERRAGTWWLSRCVRVAPAGGRDPSNAQTVT